MTTLLHPDVAGHRGAHLRVLGTPASGKTTALIERFHSLADDGLDPAVVAFSRAQRESLLDRLMPRRSARFGRFPVYTYHQLALEVVGRRPLGDMEERVVLSRALHETEDRWESDYASIAESEAFARALLAVVHVLQQNGVDPTQARRGLERAAGRRTRDVLRLFVRFEEILGERGLSTFYDVAWGAAEALGKDGSLDPLGDCRALLIDDFHDIDAGQFALVEALAPPDGSRSVAVFGDPTGARFGFRGTTSRFFDEVFVERYAPDDLTVTPSYGALSVVAKALVELAGAGGPEQGSGSAAHDRSVTGLPLFDASPPAGDASGPVVSLLVAEDEIAEAQHVAAAAARMIDSGTAPGDVAVIARERGRYELVLAHAFEERGVPFDTGAPRTYELETLVESLLGLMGGRSDDRIADQVASSPFYTALRASHAKRLRLPQRRAQHDADDVRRIVSHMKGSCFDRRTGTLRMHRFLAETARVAVEDAGAAEDAVAAVALMADEWASYEEMTRGIGARPRVDDFLRHRRAQLATLERDPRSVPFFTAREAATRSFRAAFVVGCADGVFPAMDARASYLPYAELESLFEDRGVAFHEARGRGEKLREEYALLLTALTRGRGDVRVSAPLKLRGEEVPAPSTVLRPLGDAESVADRLEGPRASAARALAVAGHGADVGSLELPPQRVARAWLEPSLEHRRFAIDAFAMSPSRLGTYVDCQRRLFYGRVLGIDEDKTIHLTLGSLFHDVLDRIGKEFPSRDELVAGLTPDRIAAFVGEVIEETDDLGPEGSLVEALTRFYLENMVSHVRAIEATRKGDYAIETELPGEFERKGRSYSGRLDRIDRVGGEPRVVIDYKTSVPGRSTSIHKTGRTIREYMLGEKGGSRRYWQVPMYSYGARAGGRFPELFCYYVVPPGEEFYVAGLYVSDDPDRHERSDFYETPKSRPFHTVSPTELEAVMDEVDAIRDEVFAQRDAFPRTDDVSRCKFCFFNRVCERREA